MTNVPDPTAELTALVFHSVVNRYSSLFCLFIYFFQLYYDRV